MFMVQHGSYVHREGHKHLPTPHRIKILEFDKHKSTSEKQVVRTALTHPTFLSLSTIYKKDEDGESLKAKKKIQHKSKKEPKVRSL